MTISKKQLEEARAYVYERGRAMEIQAAREEAKRELQAARQEGIIALTRAAAELAQANAKLTYSLSRIADKLL